MQLLLSKAAHERIAADLTALAPDLDLVLMTGPAQFEHRGKLVAAEQVDPEIVWASVDAFRDGMLPALLERLTHASKPQWSQLFVAGLDNPAFKTIMARGVRLSKSSAQSVAISEYVIAHAFSLIVPIDRQREAQQKKIWQPTSYREISQTRWTLIGYGSIGREIAKRLKPFGGHLTVVRRSIIPNDLANAVVDMSQLPEVLPQSDIVVLACSLNESTRGLANDAFFNAMKPGAVLINIGRGGLVDDEALRRGLDRDQPAQAVLDVFTKEPLPADNWMWNHPKIRVTAHTSHFGHGTMGRGDTLFLDNLKRFLAGEPLLNEASKSEVGL